jgi:hypothetical protein
MAKRRDEGAKPTDEKPEVNTARLETLADAAAGIAQAKQWQARKNGLSIDVEASEVRSLSNDADARAAAEESMLKLIAKKGEAPVSKRWTRR